MQAGFTAKQGAGSLPPPPQSQPSAPRACVTVAALCGPCTRHPVSPPFQVAPLGSSKRGTAVRRGGGAGQCRMGGDARQAGQACTLRPTRVCRAASRGVGAPPGAPTAEGGGAVVQGVELGAGGEQGGGPEALAHLWAAGRRRGAGQGGEVGEGEPWRGACGCTGTRVLASRWEPGSRSPHRLGRHDVELEQLLQEGGALQQRACAGPDGCSRGAVGSAPPAGPPCRCPAPVPTQHSAHTPPLPFPLQCKSACSTLGQRRATPRS